MMVFFSHLVRSEFAFQFYNQKLFPSQKFELKYIRSSLMLNLDDEFIESSWGFKDCESMQEESFENAFDDIQFNFYSELGNFDFHRWYTSNYVKVIERTEDK